MTQIYSNNSPVVSSNQILMKIFILIPTSKIPVQKNQKIMQGFMMINKNKAMIRIIKGI